MKTKNLYSLLMTAVIAFSSLEMVHAQADNPARGLARARVISNKIPRNEIFIVAGNDRGFRYKENPVQQGDTTISLSDVRLFFVEPVEFRQAFDLYQNRKFTEALKAFREVQETYRNVREMPHNYSAFAEFYAYECERRLMNLPALANIDSARLKKLLPWNSVSNQLSVFDLWNKAATKDWAGLETEAGKLKKTGYDKWTRPEMAQIEYLLGLAYAEQNKTKEALAALGEAMLIDSTNSLEITKAAILKSMEIYAKDPEAVSYLQQNEPGEKSQPPTPVREGAALMNLWKNVLFIAPDVPAEYSKFFAFYKAPPKPQKQEPAPADNAAETPAGDAAPAEEPAPAEPAEEEKPE